MDMQMKETVINKFKEYFGADGEIRTFFSPGRVNLIGEHIDYNGGYVLPCALTIGTYAAVRMRDDDKLRICSLNFEQFGVIERSINEKTRDPGKNFTNYPLSVIWGLKQKGYDIPCGFDMLMFGNIPNSSGLSSSASVEVLVGYICKCLFNLDISNRDIALLGQFAENEFIGVNCGIMDQFIIAMGKKDEATYLNTDTLDFKYVPVKLDNASIVIACSNKKRGLADSKYNERRDECESALRDINAHLSEPLPNLCAMPVEKLDEYLQYVECPICRRRVKHVVLENKRTVDALDALNSNDIVRFGELMNESHISLDKDYEVTGKELNTLVNASWAVPGVIGARMTGAGFGGCTVAIVKNESIEAYIKEVGKTYLDAIGYNANFYVVQVGNGPEEI